MKFDKDFSKKLLTVIYLIYMIILIFQHYTKEFFYDM